MNNWQAEILTKSRGEVTEKRVLHGKDWGVKGILQASRVKGALMGWKLMRGGQKMAWVSKWDDVTLFDGEGRVMDEDRADRNVRAPLVVRIVRVEGEGYYGS